MPATMAASSQRSTVKVAILNYINPISAPLDPKEPLQLGLGVGTPATTDEILVGKSKQIRNARGSRFTLKDDGFELLTGVAVPDVSQLEEPKTRYYAMKNLFVPLAVKLAREKLNLEPYYAHFTVPLLRKAVASCSLDVRDHNEGNAPHAMVHRYE